MNLPKVRLTTNHGDMLIELYPEKAPQTVENFLSYVKDGFYDKTIFHRVIQGFMIQGGGFDSDMRHKNTRGAIQNEADNGLKNDYGTIAMARTNAPHSATAQFFINQKDNDFLNFKSETPGGWGYCVFGKVTEGQEIIEKIAAVRTHSVGGHQNVPVTAVILEKATLVTDG